MLLLAASTTLSQYWATGPLYPNKEGSNPKCYETWWQNLLYLNNFGFGKWEKTAMQVIINQFFKKERLNYFSLSASDGRGI